MKHYSLFGGRFVFSSTQRDSVVISDGKTLTVSLPRSGECNLTSLQTYPILPTSGSPNFLHTKSSHFIHNFATDHK